MRGGKEVGGILFTVSPSDSFPRGWEKAVRQQQGGGSKRGRLYHAYDLASCHNLGKPGSRGAMSLFCHAPDVALLG